MRIVSYTCVESFFASDIRLSSKAVNLECILFASEAGSIININTFDLLNFFKCWLGMT